MTQGTFPGPLGILVRPDYSGRQNDWFAMAARRLWPLQSGRLDMGL